jgi:hypothetical protein
MYNKDIKDYLHTLRTREARPPFSEMARLVANAPARSAAAIPLYAKLAGVLAIGGMLAVGAWVLSAKYRATATIKNNLVNASSSQLTHESYGSYASHVSYGSLSEKVVHASSIRSNFANSTGAEAPVLHDSAPALHAANDDNSFLPIHPCTIREQAATPHSIAEDLHANAPIAIPSSDQPKIGNLFSTIGGAIAQQFGAPYQQTSFTDAFLGIGYNFSQNSSVRLLAGEEVFSAPSSTITKSISFTDTTFVHDGQSYQNVLGEIQSVDPPALTRVYWLGASYRYTMGDLSNAIRPFAEVMAGGSTDGFLTHQSLGAEFIATSNIDLDLLFEASELIPQNSSWLTKAGFSAAVSYCW